MNRKEAVALMELADAQRNRLGELQRIICDAEQAWRELLRESIANIDELRRHHPDLCEELLRREYARQLSLQQANDPI